MAPRRLKKNLVCCIDGKGQASGSLSTTSSGGSFVVTRYEVDTTMLASWQQLGQVFSKWRLKKLRVVYVPIKGVTTEGNFGICFLPDPNETTPTSTSTALGMEFSKIGSIRNIVSLNIPIKHNRWLFTRDAVGTTDDRLEMPGDIVCWTENTVAAFVPGVLMIEYIVEFDQIANSTVTPAQVKSSAQLEEDSVSQEIDKLKDQLKLLNQAVKSKDCANRL